MLGQLGDDAFHHFSAFVDMSVFATTEQYGHLHLVVMLKEVDRLLDLEVDIVVTGFWSDANLFQFGLMSLSFFALLLLVILELTKVHDAADGRLRFGSNFHKVQSVFTSTVQGLLGWNDTKLLALFIDDADGSNTDLFVDPILILIDCCFL